MKRTVKIVVSVFLAALFLAMPMIEVAAESATATDPCGGNHVWDSGKTTKKRGCETRGEKTYTCKRCHKTKTKKLSALGHNWGEWQETENDGKLMEKRVCARCGKYQLREAKSKVLDAKKKDDAALTIELLSFNAPEIWLPGAKATGELKVTNTGDVWVTVTSYRICDGDDQFSFIDKLENWPEGSAILPAGDSFTLSVSVVALSAEAAAKKIIRTFSVSGETFRENETEHDPVVSNTVKGTAEEVILPAALSIELLSFSGPDPLVSGSEITGELKVTNTGEVWALVTSYRICDEDGQFCFLDKLKDWPEGSAILPVGESFTLSVHVTALSPDVDANKVIRTFTVMGESFRENEKEHEDITSNTVTGTFKVGTSEDDLLTLQLLSFSGPKSIAPGAEATGMLRATNTGSSILTVNTGHVAYTDGGIPLNDKLGPFGTDAVNMVPGASCDIPVSVTVTDKDMSADKIVRVFTVSAETVPQTEEEAVRSVLSNEVIGTVKYGENTEEPLCAAALIFCHDGSHAVKITHCEEHTAFAAQVRRLQAEGRPVAKYWLGEIDALYERLLSGVSDEADAAAIGREREAFRALTERYGAVLDDTGLCLLLEAKCADLCRLVHGEAPCLPIVDEAKADTDTDSEKRFALSCSDENAGAAAALCEAMEPIVLGKKEAADTVRQAVSSLKETEDETGRAWAAWADACEDMLAVFGCEPLCAPVSALTLYLMASAL